MHVTCGFRKSEITTRQKVYTLSPKQVDSGELVRRAERGRRVAEIREAAGLTGAAFARELNKLAAAYGYPTRYSESKVSRIESGIGRNISLEEGALVVQLDPEDRGVVWLAFGGPAAKAMRRAKAR
jgi:hypothetical protein